MLGKRFHRTTSMSQLGPGHHTSQPVATSEETREMAQSPSTLPSAPHHKAARPLILQGEKLVEGRGDANIGEAPPGFDGSEGRRQDQVVEGGPCIDVLYGGGASMGVGGAVEGFDTTTHAISDIIFPETPFFKPVNPSLQVLPPHHNTGSGPLHAAGFNGKQEHAAESISPVDFLDVCFCCKRRLRHERDIFIYRGDTAFCSEECRHHQILSDERRSLRSSSKRGARATSSETAVAA